MSTERPSTRGILGGADRLALWLHASLVLLVIASALRYLQGHGLGDRAAVVLPGAALLLVVYAAGLATRRTGPAWLALLVATWVVLALLAPSFSWAAVPLVFVALQVLPFASASAVTVLLVLVVVVAWTRMTGVVDPTVVLGPVAIALLCVTAYRALERDAAERRALLADLEAAQDEVAAAERRAGSVAERARLSREIHDSVAQGLTSINLLLQAARSHWRARPDAALGHVDRAATTARSALEDVRRVVRDLAPAELDGGGSVLAEAVDRICEESRAARGMAVDLHVHGDQAPVPGAVATAVLRTVRGALANVSEHSGMRAAAVTLTFQEGAVSVDVRDDGRGFDPARTGRSGMRGHGLAGMRERAVGLGGDLVVESRPGEGTVVAASFPLPPGRAG